MKPLLNLFKHFISGKEKWKTIEIRKSAGYPIRKTVEYPGKIKIGVAFYYKNIEQYPPEWINKCIESMRLQTCNDFDVYVLNYGGREDHSFSFMMGNNYHFLHKPVNNYADAMNFIYSKIFETCDVAVNTNIDDYYSLNRIEVLLKELINGADIASSNFHIINEKNQVTYSHAYDKVNIYDKLKNGFNPVSNPCHLMKKRVFDQMQFDSSLVPAEDMVFWKKAIEAGFKIVVNKEYLHYYRMHSNQSTHKK